MGWDVGSSGLRIVLAASVADVVRSNLGSDVKGFLADQGLDVSDVRHWVAHPGGPKVVDAVCETLGLPAAALDPTRASLAAVGNLSSASVLHVLAEVLAAHPPGTGRGCGDAGHGSRLLLRAGAAAVVTGGRTPGIAP